VRRRRRPATRKAEKPPASEAPTPAAFFAPQRPAARRSDRRTYRL